MTYSLDSAWPTIFTVNIVGHRFRQQCSTSRALINTTETIRKALDDGKIGC